MGKLTDRGLNAHNLELLRVLALFYRDDPERLATLIMDHRAGRPINGLSPGNEVSLAAMLSGWDDWLQPIEQFQLRLLPKVLDAIYDEMFLLREQFKRDKEVMCVLETCKIEGTFYTLVHKLDVGQYTGTSSTLAVLTAHLKAIDRTMQKLINEVEAA